jgi:LysR family cyn operon transcriptional activator
VAPRIAVEASSISAVIGIVGCSQLATILPAAVARQNGDLVLLKLEPSLPQRTAALLRRKGAYRTAAARAFAEVATEVSQSL